MKAKGGLTTGECWLLSAPRWVRQVPFLGFGFPPPFPSNSSVL